MERKQAREFFKEATVFITLGSSNMISLKELARFIKWINLLIKVNSRMDSSTEKDISSKSRKVIRILNIKDNFLMVNSMGPDS